MKKLILKPVAILTTAMLLSGWSLWGSSVPDCDDDGISDVLGRLVKKSNRTSSSVILVWSKLSYVRQVKYDDENKIRMCQGTLESKWKMGDGTPVGFPKISVEYEVFQTTDGDQVRLTDWNAN